MSDPQSVSLDGELQSHRDVVRGETIPVIRAVVGIHASTSCFFWHKSEWYSDWLPFRGFCFSLTDTRYQGTIIWSVLSIKRVQLGTHFNSVKSVSILMNIGKWPKWKPAWIFFPAGPYSVKDKGQQKRQSDLPVFQQCQRAMICSPWPLRLHIHAIINRYLVRSRFVSTRISLLLILENRWSYRYFRTPLVGINIIFKLTWLRCDHLFWRARLSLHKLASLIASTHQ